MVSHRAVRYVRLSQICFYGFLTICTILMPHFLFERNEGGVSNFGVHSLTIIPYTMAFALSSLYLLRAATVLPQTSKSNYALRFVLAVLGVLLFLVLITTFPYKINRSLDDLHIITAELYFVAQLVAGIWFVVHLSRNLTNFLLLGLLIFGSLLSLVTLLGFVHVLFISEIVAGAAFAGLLIRAVASAVNI